MKELYATIGAIKAANPKFFGTEVMELVDSRIETARLKNDMFVTSERPVGSDERRYTARRAMVYKTEPDGTDQQLGLPDIVNVSAYGEFDNKNDAIAACREQGRMLRLRGGDLISAMLKKINHPETPGGITLLLEPARGAQLVASSQMGEDDEAPLYVYEVVFENITTLVRVLEAGKNPVSRDQIKALLIASGGVIEDTGIADSGD